MEHIKYSVLIIDDHPLIAESYRTALNYYSKQNEPIEFKIEITHDCDSALALINEAFKTKKEIDIVFLDIKLPPSKDGKILSGEDLGLKINELLPNTKIIVATTYNDNFRIHNIFKNLNPDGFLIKNDITPKELLDTIDAILNDPPYYSKTVIKLLRKQLVNGFLLDHIDRRLLYELSIGTRMKDLPDILFLSLAGVEKRKRQLKLTFNVKNEDDKELLFIAKEKGFI
ncbi:response regulator [Mariniflexile gromovii]|uniref:Response regulator transcription factor n=1 Tax=Mariniflexile gromovii TaxID=362523 RepID=A0ABS4BX99_9FLAO|nr:response regulator [Mariniflexile gromovii]MBP0904616.1 response regulator transcription factor [Mariniflexile gromovii]